MGGNRKLLAAIAVTAVVGVALAVGAFALAGCDEEKTPVDATRSGYLADIPQGGVTLGDPAATVTLIQFEDLQCPVCKRYQDEGFRNLVEEYVATGKVKVRFVGLAFLGIDSEISLRHALAAGKHGKLFQFAEELYARQGGENSGWVTETLLAEIATALGLDPAAIAAEADGADITAQSEEMAAEAATREVPGTPWFFVQVGNGEPYAVQVPSFAVESFRPILDDALGG